MPYVEGDGSFETLSGLPRVPRTEGNGVQIGVGGIPPKRRYRAGRLVDYGEAVSMFNQIQSGERPPVAGGLDDNDPALFDRNATITPTTSQKMRVAQSKALTEEDIGAIKLGHPAGQDASSHQPESSQPVKTEQPSQTEQSEQSEQSDRRNAPAMKPKARNAVPASGIVERIVERPVEKVVEKVVEKIVEKPVETVFSKWSSKRVRVEVSTDEMTFNVSAIDAVRSMYGLVIFLPSSGDSMTFVPKPGSHVRVLTRDLGPMDTVYTGTSFDMGELGFMGLCFLVRDGAEGPDGSDRLGKA